MSSVVSASVAFSAASETTMFSIEQEKKALTQEDLIIIGKIEQLKKEHISDGITLVIADDGRQIEQYQAQILESGGGVLVVGKDADVSGLDGWLSVSCELSDLAIWSIEFNLGINSHTLLNVFDLSERSAFSDGRSRFFLEKTLRDQNSVVYTPFDGLYMREILTLFNISSIDSISQNRAARTQTDIWLASPSYSSSLIQRNGDFQIAKAGKSTEKERSILGVNAADVDRMKSFFGKTPRHFLRIRRDQSFPSDFSFDIPEGELIVDASRVNKFCNTLDSAIIRQGSKISIIIGDPGNKRSGRYAAFECFEGVVIFVDPAIDVGQIEQDETRATFHVKSEFINFAKFLLTPQQSRLLNLLKDKVDYICDDFSILSYDESQLEFALLMLKVNQGALVTHTMARSTAVLPLSFRTCHIELFRKDKLNKPYKALTRQDVGTTEGIWFLNPLVAYKEVKAGLVPMARVGMDQNDFARIESLSKKTAILSFTQEHWQKEKRYIILDIKYGPGDTPEDHDDFVRTITDHPEIFIEVLLSNQSDIETFIRLNGGWLPEYVAQLRGAGLSDILGLDN
jgi:hypothetical protein